MYDLVLFDKVVAHLLKQNAKSETSFGCCRYRGPNGLKCAVGFLISDKAYSDRIECKSVVDDEVRVALAMPGVSTTEDNILMLTALQRLHDRYEVSKWASEAAKLREIYVVQNILENRPIA